MSFVTARIRARTLRGRLTLWYLLILGSSLAAFAVLIDVAVAQSLYRHHDEALALGVERLADTLQGKTVTVSETAAALARVPDLPAYVTVWNANGAAVYDSADSHSNAHPGCGQGAEPVQGTGSRLRFFTARAGRAGPIRFVCAPLGPRPGPVLQVGLALGDVNRTLDTVAAASAIMLPVVLALTSFGGLVIARRALAPLEAIADTIRDVQATDLSRRIDVHPHEEELSRLVSVLNQLLGRLEGAFASLREFAADASHQLQTPLTVVKGSIEVALRSSATADDGEPLLVELLDEVDHMIALGRDLHALSVADVGTAHVSRVPVAFSELARTTTEIIEALGESKHVSVRSNIENDLTVWGDEIRLRQVMLNLGENAVKYTPAGGHVGIRLTKDDRHAVLQVSDTGPGIHDDDLPHIFDRFYRATRAGHTSGTGLGLTIAQRIVVAHGGTLAVQSRVNEGSTFEVRLPLA